MQQVERHEEALRAAAERAALQPETIAEVDALEKKLSEALEELRSRRAELEKPTEPSEKPEAKKKDGRGGKK